MTPTNNIPAISEVEKEHINQLISVAQNELQWKAVKWFVQQMDLKMSGVQLNLAIHTPEGQRDYYIAQGRRIGLWDLVTVVEAEVKERQKKIDDSFTDLSKK